jgi:hypothetical protein
MLDRMSIIGRCSSTHAFLKRFAHLLFLFICFYLLFLCGDDTVAAATQWSAANGITIIEVAGINGTDLKMYGPQKNDWNIARMPLPFSKLEVGATYRLEGWMKIDSLSNIKYPPTFRLVVYDINNKYIGSYRTFAYAYSSIARNTWQKLWMEVVADDRFDHGYITIDKDTLDPIMVDLYIRSLSFEKIKNSLTYAENAKVSYEKINDVFWPFKKSDVISFVPGTLTNYKDYGVSFVSWGSIPGDSASSVASYCKMIAEASIIGTKIGARQGLRTEFGGFINISSNADIVSAQCRDLTGKALIEPSSPNVVTRGYPAFWFSINNTKFREFIIKGVERAAQCRPFGLVLDDPLGDAPATLWYNGEYSANGVIALRDYMKSVFTDAQLSQLGISDITTFDINKYHQRYLNVNPERRPFRKEMIDSQLKSSADMLKAVKAAFLKKLDQRVPFSGNIDPASPSDGRLLLDVDYYSFECSMNATSGRPNNGYSLLSYKFADALKRPAVAMGSGGDHAFVAENNLLGLLRCWMAEAYAFGNYFMAPYSLWANSNAKGAYWYTQKNSKEIAPLYQFVKSHNYLFDSYEVIAPIALVVSYSSYVQGRTNIYDLTKTLADKSIPFEIVIAGDDVLGLHLSTSQLAGYSNLILPDGSMLCVDDAMAVQRMKNAGKSIVKKIEDLDKASQIRIQGVTGVRATLRAVKNDNVKPVVVHMLNDDYNVSSDSCKTKINFTIKIPKQLLQNRAIKEVKYIRPPSWVSKGVSEPIYYTDVALDFRDAVDFIEIMVPSLDVWGILALS